MVRDLLARIGTDRFLTQTELADAARWVLNDAWRVYRSHFEGFTGARTDAQFARLVHPARAFAKPRVMDGTTIVIAGTGPSLAHRAGDLHRLRERISLWTSVRGAEALAHHGLSPDLVIVQHTTDLDAYLTLRHLRDRDGATSLPEGTMVLAEPKTPAALLREVRQDRLATFDPAIGWGLWPASLAWLAGGSGARAASLVGIDLGTTGAPDPSQRPLTALLGLIAEGGTIATKDGGDGAPKGGWVPEVLDATVGPTGSSTVEWEALAPWTLEERRHSLDEALVEMRDHLEAAEMFRARAIERRDSGGQLDDGPLSEAWSILLGWRESAPLRAAFQDSLGATFLPRFWRTAVESVQGPLWRPVLLATDEVVRQARAARAALAAGGRA